jgi:hypothetical protein
MKYEPKVGDIFKVSFKGIDYVCHIIEIGIWQQTTIVKYRWINQNGASGISTDTLHSISNLENESSFYLYNEEEKMQFIMEQ